MKILVITKRQYTGKDLLKDRYGRLFEIPNQLHHLGHDVRGIAFSYRNPQPYQLQNFDAPWDCIHGRPFSPVAAINHISAIKAHCTKFKPDVVWASSDAWHAIAAWQVCTSRGTPYVVDLYDNYESFGLSNLPGVIPLMRRACRAANGLTLISHTLADHVTSNYALPTNQPQLVLGNAVDTEKFRPLSRLTARRKLGLAENALMIGTAGALDTSRGIATLLEAVERLATTHPNLRLVLAGPCDGSLNRFRHLPIDYLGILPSARVPTLWNALDVAVVVNRDSDFGRYCYPQKLQEIVACGVPLVASRVGEVANLLHETPACLADPDSPTALAERINAQIQEKIRVNRNQVCSWAQRAEEISKFFETILARTGKGNQYIGDGEGQMRQSPDRLGKGTQGIGNGNAR